MDLVTASFKVVGIRPSGERIEIELLIGKPFLNESSPVQQWRCPVSCKPLYGGVINMAGADAVQALCEALKNGFGQLASFKHYGGQLLYDDGTDFSLEYYEFPSSGQNNA
ncbi:hypothetical protein [Stenotrophobium rhamnosiphilum]|uniref:Uncharacterized protein n=1 Tax=Stenotrophobium rhamnosiphilum TaxID=2029166 RepID=A0A2T5MKL1_9GAMM|nr:hypothetical protein [Stenotrophobium rhamnosiphilum]PTU33112.1 hypothetical protein CJD38_03125 [Stenotrophobium rhamnosiphilum]